MARLLPLALLLVAAVLLWRWLRRPELPGRPADVSRESWLELLKLCHGNDVQALRLYACEKERTPGLSPDEACRAASWRLQRDNR